jgi:acetyl-CoA carboxylase alpha subunit
MKILKSSSKGECVSGKIVGAMLPGQLHSYLSLYAVATSQTKTSIVKKELQKWAELEMKVNTEDVLVKLLSDKILESWEKFKDEHKKATFSTFKAYIKTELKDKGISYNIIREIFKIIE